MSPELPAKSGITSVFYAAGQKVDKVAKDSDRDNFMSPDEAVKYGLIDNVVDSRLKE